jgi:hypothetical protein
VEEADYFKAEDKYTLVVTKEGESLIEGVLKNWPRSLIPVNSGRYIEEPS